MFIGNHSLFNLTCMAASVYAPANFSVCASVSSSIIYELKFIIIQNSGNEFAMWLDDFLG